MVRRGAAWECFCRRYRWRRPRQCLVYESDATVVMGKAKKAAGGEKKLAKRQAQVQALQRQECLRSAYARGDPFAELQPFAAFNRNGLVGEARAHCREEVTVLEGIALAASTLGVASRLGLARGL